MRSKSCLIGLNLLGQEGSLEADNGHLWRCERDAVRLGLVSSCMTSAVLYGQCVELTELDIKICF